MDIVAPAAKAKIGKVMRAVFANRFYVMNFKVVRFTAPRSIGSNKSATNTVSQIHLISYFLGNVPGTCRPCLL
jgi:hypothetical protein